MQIKKTRLEGCVIVESDRFDDDRGWFRETWRAEPLRAATGRDFSVAQNNHSRSRQGVLRGFHAEPWHKLFYVAHGTAFLVVADVRPGSPTFGQTVDVMLGDGVNYFARVFVAQGLANAFYCLSEVDYINEVSKPFSPHGRGGVRWDDPTLDVNWPSRNPILSEQDRSLPFLSEAAVA